MSEMLCSKCGHAVWEHYAIDGCCFNDDGHSCECELIPADIYSDQLAAMTAKLELCKATLEVYADVRNWGCFDSHYPDDTWKIDGNGYDLARKTLAEVVE